MSTSTPAATRTSPPRRLVVGALGLAIACLAACSLLVERREQQCQTDAECSAFPAAVCDVKQGVCVKRSGAGCVDASGCYACAPTTTQEFQSACTDAGCVPYDNSALKPLLTADGGLPPVP